MSAVYSTLLTLMFGEERVLLRGVFVLPVPDNKAEEVPKVQSASVRRNSPVKGLCRCLRRFLMSVLCSEEAMRKAGTAHNKSSTDMENHVFIKAKSRVSPQVGWDRSVLTAHQHLCSSFRMSICRWWRG